MLFLIERLWPALAAAASLGFLFAAIGGSGRMRPSAGRALPAVLAVGWAVAALASAFGWVFGRPGLWLDISVLVLGAYGLGCLAGAGLDRLLRRARLAPEAGPPASATPAGPDPTTGAGSPTSYN